MVQTLREMPGIRIERIVSRGQASPEGFWYDQPRHEFVVVLRGAARLQFEDGGELIELTAGSYLDIPPTGGTESSGPTRVNPRSGWRCITETESRARGSRNDLDQPPSVREWL